MNGDLVKYKVLIIGNSSSGKTSILLRYSKGQFSDLVAGTIGVDYQAQAYDRGGKKYYLNIWDTAGQERFKHIISAYYRDAHAVVLVFDLHDYKSFEAIDRWHSLVLENTNKDVLFILVGNKSDLVHMVTQTEIQQTVSRLKISTYIQTSAKSGERITEVFDRVLEKLISTGCVGVVQRGVDIKRVEPALRTKCCVH
jgi:small GTP-binding protein